MSIEGGTDGDRSLGDRAAGCLLGLALGDALGAPFEQRRRHEIPDPIPALELPWMGGPPGSTTDDTAMALNLALSLSTCGGFDADDVVRRHLEWFAAGPPDVGSITAKVLRRVAGQAGPDGPAPSRGLGLALAAETAAAGIWSRRGPEVSAGNGSVMYCAPLGVAYARRPGLLFELAPRLSGLTHHDERCRSAVLAVTLAVAALVRGDTPRAAASEALGAVADRDGGEELEFLVEAVGRSRPIDGPDQGFCLYAAAAGIQAILEPAGGFEPALRHVVALGGDTDTNAAVAGALLGAHAGRAELPARWLERLEDRERIERSAERLIPFALTGSDETWAKRDSRA